MSNNGNKGSALATVRRAAGLSSDAWSDERIETIKQLCAPQAKTVHELAGFLAFCNRYDLDPMLNEAWLGQMDGKPAPITGRDGLVKAAQRDPGYAGFDSGVVYEKDDFRIERHGAEVVVHHTIGGLGSRGKILGAYCVVHHEERRPVLITRQWDQYSHLHGRRAWKQSPEDMIETRAIVAGLKRQYRLGNVYTAADGGTAQGDTWEEEASGLDDLNQRLAGDEPEKEAEQPADDDHSSAIEDAEYTVVESDNDDSDPEPEPDDPEPDPDQEERDKLNRTYFALVGELDWSTAERKLWQEQKVGKASCRDWTVADYEAAITLIRAGDTDIEVPRENAEDQEAMPL